MAKNKIQIDVKVDDKGGTKKLGVESKKTAKNLDKVGSSARTVDRNVKGAAQASSSGTKNFSKMAQGAGGLVGVYATLAATAFAVSAAFNFLKSAMDFTNLLEGQKAMGAITGVAYKTISDSLVDATNGQLKYERTYIDSKLDGVLRNWNEDGVLRTKFIFENNIKTVYVQDGRKIN